MDDNQWAADSVLDVVGDPLARRLLALLSEDRKNVDALANQLEVSEPTIYRRLDELTGYDLVDRHKEVAADGHHFNTYETAVEAISIEIENGAYTVDVTLNRSLVDRFDSFWSDLGESSPSEAEGDRTESATPRTEWTVTYE